MLPLPFAYLLAEPVGACGVLVVVVRGLVVARVGPRVGHPATRTQTATFLVVVTCDTRALDRTGTHPLRQVGDRARVVNTVAAFRGAVSLAVALSVPARLASGAPFPERDLIVSVTAGVVATTLVVQGLVMPRTIAWARLPDDHDAARERWLAERVALEAALGALPEVARHLGTDPAAAERPRGEHEHRRQVLRDEGRIDDVLLREVQARLDAEELRLSPDEGDEDR